MQGKRRALIFAGAGASYAVDSEAYPTTVQFFEKLPDSIRNHPLVNALAKHLPSKFGEGTPDVEKILWVLDELQQYLFAVDDSKHPAHWLLANNSLAGYVGSRHGSNEYTALARDAVKIARKLRNDISAKVYDFYSATPSKEAVLENWQEVFNLLARGNYWADIATTNYDLVVEHAAEYAGQLISLGVGRGIVRALDTDVWKRSLADPNYLPSEFGLLTKLHGSLNWLREDRQIIFGGTRFKGDHSYHGVIYPGFKGIPKEEPFSLLHSYFEAAIQRAELIVFIGFAFRDEYITTCLDRNVGNKLIHLIDPGTVRIPASLERNVRHIQLGFGKEAVSELTKLVI